MERIKKNIADNQYERFYLICGNNDYMKKLYSNKLKSAIIMEGNEINLTEYDSDKLDANDVVGMAQTMPFFTDYRLIVIKNSGLFANSSDFDEQLKDIPESTVMVFVEDSVDKRNKMFKFVKNNGYICEINELDERAYIAFVNKCLAENGVRIEQSNAAYLISRIGSDMNTVINECEKLSAYCIDKGYVDREDIDEISTVLLENKIFEMIECVASAQKAKALKLYSDLLLLKEAPLKILKLIQRHFNILYIIKTGMQANESADRIAKEAKIPTFFLKKYIGQTQRYTAKELLEFFRNCVEIEEDFKNGRIDVEIGLEMLICQIMAD